MATVAKCYTSLMMALATKKMNLQTDTLKVMLVNNYTFSQDTHKVKADIDALAVEVTGTGYTAGGQALTGVTLQQDDATNTLKLDATDPSWGPSSTITADGAILYDDTATNKDLICFLDFQVDKISNNGVFPITWDSAGIVTLNTP